jgi:hypothetical protein
VCEAANMRVKFRNVISEFLRQSENSEENMIQKDTKHTTCTPRGLTRVTYISDWHCGASSDTHSQATHFKVRFEVLVAASKKMTVF